MLSLIKYWQLAAGLFSGLTLAWLVNSAIIAPLHKAKIEAVKQETLAQCAEAKKITTEASNELQTKLSAVSRRLADLKRLRQPACVPVTGAASRHDAEAGAGQPARPHGVDANSLYDFAAEAEKYRQQLLTCQQFVIDTWRVNGQ